MGPLLANRASRVVPRPQKDWNTPRRRRLWTESPSRPLCAGWVGRKTASRHRVLLILFVSLPRQNHRPDRLNYVLAPDLFRASRSCERVYFCFAKVCLRYKTLRYRSQCVSWAVVERKLWPIKSLWWYRHNVHITRISGAWFAGRYKSHCIPTDQSFYIQKDTCFHIRIRCDFSSSSQ